jgi:hypothetical protein
MSSTPAPSEAAGPQRFDSLPPTPLAASQVATVKDAFEMLHDGDVTIWVAPRSESVTQHLGPVTLSSTKMTILEFIVETDGAYQTFRYEPGADGHWLQFDPAEKGTPAADLRARTINEEDYRRLDGLDEGGDA